jgi:hypothetical protein
VTLILFLAALLSALEFSSPLAKPTFQVLPPQDHISANILLQISLYDFKHEPRLLVLSQTAFLVISLNDVSTAYTFGVLSV